MKYLFTILLMMIAVAFQASAQGAKSTGTKSRPVAIEIKQRSNIDPKVHRAPMHINIDVWYNPEENAVEVSCPWETEGEVYVFSEENVIGYDSELNTSIQLPTTTGLYTIVIESDTWMAEGVINL